MRVNQRLFLAVLPAILGVFTVVGLAYWGQYARQAPQLLVIVAVLAAVGSLALAWWNARYVAQRIERLAELARQQHSPRRTSDELETIEATVHGLSNAVDAARDDVARRVRAAEAQAEEHATLLDTVMRQLATRIEEAQLPLHILLESPFGSLNENQEEMLGAAEGAVDAADAELRRMRKLVALDHGRVTPVAQPIGLAELLRPALAIADARAGAAHVMLLANVSDTAPRVLADPVLAQEALTTILGDAVSRAAAAGSGQEVTVAAHETDEGRVRIAVSQTPGTRSDSLEMRLAERMLTLQGALLRDEAGARIIELPAERTARVPGR